MSAPQIIYILQSTPNIWEQKTWDGGEGEDKEMIFWSLDYKFESGKLDGLCFSW